MTRFSFLLKTAIRDSRKDRAKLFMFMSSIILGISALVAINSFNYNLVKDIDNQAATLLGADIAITGNRQLSDTQQAIVDSLDIEAEATETELFSMSYVPKTDASHFVRLKALEGQFPFYGVLKTEPASAYHSFQNAKEALVDYSLMAEHGLVIGDSIKLGTQIFMISGELQSAFGSIGISSSFAPTVYIAKRYLDSTDLVQPGSIVDYAYYYKLNDDVDADAWKEKYNKNFRDERLRIQTIEGQKENLDEAFSSLNNFLNLIALVSLLLGCIGVASSVLIYIKKKIPSIAILRCLGMKGNHAFIIFLIQITALGIASVIIGAILGAVIQKSLPILLQDFLPYQVDMSISWRAVMEGIVAGSIITLLFSIAPLVGIRKISPLRTLRSSFEEDAAPIDPLQISIYVTIALSLILFLFQLTKDLKTALIFGAGLLLSYVILFLISKLVIWASKHFIPRQWNFVFRQGLSNLYRPNNQTLTLLISIGLGSAILTTLFIIQGLLLSNVSSMDSGNQPNMILYGIERHQTEEVKSISAQYDLPIIQDVPIVTMRLAAWKGKTRNEWLADTTRKSSRWAINREARVTYRNYLESDEELIAGRFVGEVASGDSVFISLDQGYAESLDVALNDELVWNVQGTLIKTYVSSFRDIEFRSMRTRFFILFPNGVLENAPQFNVIVTKSPDPAVTASYRSAVVKALPNVSVVDLSMILSTLNDILSKVSYVIKFMAAFSILTGLIVLISSLMLSKFQRVKESVLLRTLGASKNQILKINATEYGLLGGLSALTGIMISIVAAYLLSKFQFELDFDLNWLPIIAIFLLVTLITVIIGLLNSREVIIKTPLEVLRNEV